MGILDRFTSIVKANINELLDKAEDPEKMVDQYLREMTESLAEVREATAGVMAEEKRCKKLLDENREETEKYEELARKALAAGNEACSSRRSRSWRGAPRALRWPTRARRPTPTKCARCTTSWWPTSRS